MVEGLVIDKCALNLRRIKGGLIKAESLLKCLPKVRIDACQPWGKT